MYSEYYKQEEVYVHQPGHNMPPVYNLSMAHTLWLGWLAWLGKYPICMCALLWLYNFTVKE